MKSSRSMITFPALSGSKALQTLNPSAHGIDPRVMIIPAKRAAFFLSWPKRSMEKLTSFSNTPIMVERAAKYMNRKKRLPSTLPPFMEVNTLGRVRKIRLGPLSGATP